MTGAQSLGDGPAGAALLAVERGENPRPWLAEMVAAPIMAHPDDASLFEGAPAVAFTLAALPRTRALSTLDEQVDAITRARLDAAHRRADRGDLPTKREFDLISGITGLGAYLLRRHGGGELLRDVLAYLVRLTEPRADGLPGWWALDGPTGPGWGWEGGHGNLGIAHGITGPLALLALTARRGVIVDGQADAMRRICAWLDRFRGGSAPRMWWPETLTRGDHDHGRVPEGGPYRPSWCYGTPGIAYAQHLAGSPSTTEGGNASRSTPWRGASPTKPSLPGLVTCRCVTAGPGSSTSHGVRAHTIPASARPCRACSTGSPPHYTRHPANAGYWSGKPARCSRSTP